jgi:hypothetical protein
LKAIEREDAKIAKAAHRAATKEIERVRKSSLTPEQKLIEKNAANAAKLAKLVAKENENIEMNARRLRVIELPNN